MTESIILTTKTYITNIFTIFACLDLDYVTMVIFARPHKRFKQPLYKVNIKTSDSLMELNFIGLICAVATFFIIGLFHPIVIKGEYYFGTRCWWVFCLLGIAFLALSLLVDHQVTSTIMGVIGCSCLWSILELFEQKKRVERGWFPKNPKRKY